jgi:hypothetical protein
LFLPGIEVLSLSLPTSDTVTIPMYTPFHALIIIIIIVIVVVVVVIGPG